jgi:hypothetical protein
MQPEPFDNHLEMTMKALKFLTAAALATLAATAYAGPYGPGPGTGCAAGNVPGSGDCPAYGSGNGPGAGGPRGARFAERMRAADTNADGMISREEAQAGLPGLAARFDTIDANADGNITLAEMQAARAAHRQGNRGEGWKQWDADGDGRLSRAETASAPRLSQEFGTIDTNGDGFLTVEELQAAHGQFAGRVGRRGS